LTKRTNVLLLNYTERTHDQLFLNILSGKIKVKWGKRPGWNILKQRSGISLIPVKI